MASRELDHLRKVYLSAEVSIINEIARLRSRGLIDYHAVAALERVQKILLGLQDASWKYVPRMIERYFYVAHPDKYTRAEKTLQGHIWGYGSASSLTATQIDTVSRLVYEYIGNMESASAKIMADMSDMLLGRKYGDIFRQEGLEASIRLQAGGTSFQGEKGAFIDALRTNGVTAFVDKAGRKWSLHAYTDMVLRTTTHQAQVLAMLERDPEQDLYYIPPIGSTCPICAPLEGRIFSKSGKDTRFAPLASAFGKVNKAGPNTLENSYLNIHPNCLHAIIPYVPPVDEKKREEIERRSDPRLNPLDRDPRSEAQIEAYRNNQKARQKWLADFEQFERYRLAIPDKVPKTFQTFQKHKLAGDAKYDAWVKAYRELSG